MSVRFILFWFSWTVFGEGGGRFGVEYGVCGKFDGLELADWRGVVHLRARSTRSGIGSERKGKRPRESQGQEELKGFARWKG